MTAWHFFVVFWLCVYNLNASPEAFAPDLPEKPYTVHHIMYARTLSEQALQECIAQSPQDGSAWYELGVRLVQSGRTEKAHDALINAAYYGHPLAHLKLALCVPDNLFSDEKDALEHQEQHFLQAQTHGTKPLLQSLKSRRDPEAITYIGVLSALNIIFPRDLKKCEKYLRYAAKRYHHVDAQYYYSVFHFMDTLKSISYPTAQRMLRAAADTGYAPAASDLGLLYCTSAYNTPRNYDLAGRYLLAAMENTQVLSKRQMRLACAALRELYLSPQKAYPGAQLYTDVPASLDREKIMRLHDQVASLSGLLKAVKKAASRRNLTALEQKLYRNLKGALKALITPGFMISCIEPSYVLDKQVSFTFCYTEGTASYYCLGQKLKNAADFIQALVHAAEAPAPFAPGENGDEIGGNLSIIRDRVIGLASVDYLSARNGTFIQAHQQWYYREK